MRKQKNELSALQSASNGILNLPIVSLQTHPLSAKIYRSGLDEGIVQSVREHGVLEPLLVTKGHVIISGHRRLKAARERQGSRKDVGSDIVANSPQGETCGKARDLAAAKVGLAGRSAENGLKVLDAIVEREESENMQLVEEVRTLLNERSRDAAFKRATALGWTLSKSATGAAKQKAMTQVDHRCTNVSPPSPRASATLRSEPGKMPGALQDNAAHHSAAVKNLTPVQSEQSVTPRPNLVSAASIDRCLEDLRRQSGKSAKESGVLDDCLKLVSELTREIASVLNFALGVNPAPLEIEAAMKGARVAGFATRRGNYERKASNEHPHLDRMDGRDLLRLSNDLAIAMSTAMGRVPALAPRRQSEFSNTLARPSKGFRNSLNLSVSEPDLLRLLAKRTVSAHVGFASLCLDVESEELP